MSVLGVIGGSGVYALDALEDARWEKVASPFGAPSDEVLRGRLHGIEMAFLPRHGRGHRIPPSLIDYRANIDALKRCGVTDLVSISACGSLREELSPGTFVLVDQFIDRTVARQSSFFGRGLAAHVSMADPVCARAVASTASPSRAESHLYRSWGCDVIGMTNMPEAKLAREAELCYASVAMVTDYDCWHPHEDDVAVADIVALLARNAALGRQLVTGLAPRLAGRVVPCPAGCDRALEGAVITDVSSRDPVQIRHLDAVAGRVLRGA